MQSAGASTASGSARNQPRLLRPIAPPSAAELDLAGQLRKGGIKTDYAGRELVHSLTDTRATVPCTLSYQIVLFWSLGVANRYRHSRGSHAASPPPSFLKQNVPHGKL